MDGIATFYTAIMKIFPENVFIELVIIRHQSLRTFLFLS